MRVRICPTARIIPIARARALESILRLGTVLLLGTCTLAYSMLRRSPGLVPTLPGRPVRAPLGSSYSSGGRVGFLILFHLLFTYQSCAPRARAPCEARQGPLGHGLYYTCIITINTWLVFYYYYQYAFRNTFSIPGVAVPTRGALTVGVRLRFRLPARLRACLGSALQAEAFRTFPLRLVCF